MKYCLLTLLLMSFSISAEVFQFADIEQEQRFNQLTAELRCLQCQNQSLADSHADLALDLKKEIYRLMQEGQSNAEIKLFLVDRYGNFILYLPEFSDNKILWLLPIVLFVFAMLWLLLVVRKQPKNKGLSVLEQEKLKKMLEKES